MAMNLKVLAARKGKALTQPELAHKIGIDKVDIIRVERAGWIPPKDVRKSMAKALGEPEDALFGKEIADLSV